MEALIISLTLRSWEPPSRPEDHRIQLLAGSIPPTIRSYRYPFHQKIEIELLVRDLLKQGIICPSTSSFSSPVLAMPDFSKPFTTESDACGNGLGAVLLQDEHPIAFTSKSLSGKY